ncbi:hypothetical protein EGU77_18015 [Pseudomonas syringae pv. theae]|nr:hypothetical protein [Pseudomonas syringae pv. theae]MBL3837116.1 hypothetical protein [Pseudomonas syringae pv. theae]MBL3868485.1 hypothetical protein [Pseudomonas syringae pv. theae]
MLSEFRCRYLCSSCIANGNCVLRNYAIKVGADKNNLAACS